MLCRVNATTNIMERNKMCAGDVVRVGSTHPLTPGKYCTITPIFTHNVWPWPVIRVACDLLEEIE